MTSLAFFSLTTGAAGCASSTPARDTTARPSAVAAETPTQSTAPATPPAVSGGSIAREDLVVTLDAGFGHFLSNVETEPARDGDRFVGFRIVRFFEDDARFAGVGLHAGDTVTHVNGRRIERPEDALAAWNELRVASELVVRFLREGNEREIRFPIIN